MKGKWIWCFLWLVVMLAASPGGSRAFDPIRIAMITAKTGKAERNAISFEGARFAVGLINQRGGLLGREVQLLEYDNKSTAEGSAEAARQALKDGAVAVVGCNWSSHSLAMAEVLQEARVPMVTHISTNPAVTQVGDYIFRACFTDQFQGEGLAKYAHDFLKSRTVVVLADRDRIYSQGLAQTFAKAFETLGGKVVWQGEYAASDVASDSIIDAVKQHDPDALFIPTGYKDVAAFLEKARGNGVDCDILSADGITMNLYELIGDKAEGLYFSGHWSKWIDTEESQEFILQYVAHTGKEVESSTLALVYDSFNLLADAIRRANSVEGDKIRDALAQTADFEGATGRIRFQAGGDPIKALVINRFSYGDTQYMMQLYP